MSCLLSWKNRKLCRAKCFFETKRFIFKLSSGIVHFIVRVTFYLNGRSLFSAIRKIWGLSENALHLFQPPGEGKKKAQTSISIRSEESVLILSLGQSVAGPGYKYGEKLKRNICFTCSMDLCLDFHWVRSDEQQTTWCNIIIFISANSFSEFWTTGWAFCTLISESINSSSWKLSYKPADDIFPILSMPSPITTGNWILFLKVSRGRKVMKRVEISPIIIIDILFPFACQSCWQIARRYSLISLLLFLSEIDFSPSTWDYFATAWNFNFPPIESLLLY